MIPGQEEGMKTIRAIVCCFLAISATASAQPQQGVLFTNVMVWDGTSEALRKADVLVTGNKISEVSDEPLAVIQSTDMMVIDGGGRTLMPGLIDAHVHLNMQFGGHATDRGIQGMQNLTWEEMGALAYESARALRRDGSKSNLELLGVAWLADGADDVLKAARNNLAAGADFAKMMSGGGITSERDPIESIQGTMAELEAIVTATGQFGTVAAVHAYHDTSVQNAITAGVMSIEHGNLMEDPDTFKMVAKAGAWIVPAMAAFAPDILDHPYYGNPALPAYAKTARVQKNGEKWVELANRFKVNLGFGSDVIIVTKEVWRPARDFQITQWGRAFGNYRTLKAMTSDNGRLMALTGVMNPYPHGKLGVIEEGAYADIILVDGNPLEDLSVIGAVPSMFGSTPRPTPSVDTIRLVMKDGKVYKNTL
jgi:imidazolonepropionase-like amidohydrolase